VRRIELIEGILLFKTKFYPKIKRILIDFQRNGDTKPFIDLKQIFDWTICETLFGLMLANYILSVNLNNERSLNLFLLLYLESNMQTEVFLALRINSTKHNLDFLLEKSSLIPSESWTIGDKRVN